MQPPPWAYTIAGLFFSPSRDCTIMILPLDKTILNSGTEHVSKSDEFSEKFQTAFDPPPLILGKLYCAFRDKSAYVHMEALLCVI